MAKTIVDMVNDPKYIVVYTSEKFNKPVGRFVSKKVLQKIVSHKCDAYKRGQCNDCFTDKQELETDCLDAWQLTVGKGKKLY
ncbi:hypothetical protein PP175_27925 (plasmid) [Aneurinibacillus sp. Ricciae_BoGa-3]|uniref:hypothetical protein n=1 Tax=Aneurinibacillus sp. Ricciae_BoGa-3 TaxID=3022697 RepID=UPI0023424E32|nr:hypothetical protein [Aneurinibacillus sp. Ricciae_BoGa-3]WCK57021.1 hypothetical protein PP175_27925 [Aneurinibacillus sp. Ricciae_BoGa-3]